MNYNFDEQFARIEMDMAWDNYLEACEVEGISPMLFSAWKESYNKNL